MRKYLFVVILLITIVLTQKSFDSNELLSKQNNVHHELRLADDEIYPPLEKSQLTISALTL